MWEALPFRLYMGKEKVLDQNPSEIHTDPLADTPAQKSIDLTVWPC